MAADLGRFSILFALMCAAYSMVAGILAGREKDRWRQEQLWQSARRGMLAVFLLCSLATGILVHAFVTNDYNITYVWSESNRGMPVQYKVSALWGGQEGSLLLWVFILSCYGALMVWRPQPTVRGIMPYTAAVMAITQVFFLLLVNFNANPFRVEPPHGAPLDLPWPPSDGRGLNPLLQNYWMQIHPPALYIGYVGLTVPFCYGMAAMWSGKLDSDWIIAVRRWTLFAWTFLGCGILLGGIWAYETLSFGGYWAWDPVENASLIPWLTGTAFLHSVMIQEKKGMLKGWNMVLVIITFALSIFGTFLTRSGIIQSVHAFAQSGIGPYFWTFLLLMIILGFGFLFLRGWYVSAGIVTLFTFGLFIVHTFGRLKTGIRPPDPSTPNAALPPEAAEYLFLAVSFAVTGAMACVVFSELMGLFKNDGKPRYNALQGDNEFESWLSREAAFLVNNWLFIGAAFAVLFGTMLPNLTEALFGVRITAAGPYFNVVMPPIGLALLFLTGVGPLIPWRRASPKNLWRNLRVPAAVAGASMPILLLMGVRRDAYIGPIPISFSLIVLATCVFVTAAIVWEFYRGAKARHDLTGESYFAGLINLTLRNRRRYGGYIVHFAIALFFAGVTGSMMYKVEVRKDLQPSDTMRIAGYELKLDKVTRERVPGWKESLLAYVDVSLKGRKLVTLKPRQDTFEGFEGEMQQTPIPAILYTPQHDLYLVLRQVANPNDLKSTSIHLQVYLFPLLMWVWVSGVIFLIGNFICMLPGGKELRAPERVTAKGWVMER